MRMHTIVLSMATLLAGLLAVVVASGPRAFSEPEPNPAGEAPRYSRSGHDVARLPAGQIDALAAKLTPEQREILLDKGTELAFCGDLYDNKKEGTYLCRLCSLPLFASRTKFTSGSGWPSFWGPYDKDHIEEKADFTFGMRRVEILCQRCGGHLGHVFDDGPRPTGMRYCLNSASLEFIEEGKDWPEMAQPIDTETAYFAGGCFWGVEDRFQQVPGVIDAVSGYMGGSIEEPGYREVCSGSTGHAETVRVVYDPAEVTYAALLERFFQFHNPTQLNRQGPDVGTQYRSAIFAATPEQLDQARKFVDEQQSSEKFADKRIATVVEAPGPVFYEAEDYHQDYHAKHGGSCPIP